MIDADYEKLTAAYDPLVRVAECPDQDASCISRIEVDFAIPVEMTQAQQRRLVEAVADIAHAPWNLPTEGVHWLAGTGSKPMWSRVDAAMLGVPAGPDAPHSGEPTFDDTIFFMETNARHFMTVEEREKKLADRAKPKNDVPARNAIIAALEAVAHFWGFAH
jgi:hypothetical protein